MFYNDSDPLGWKLPVCSRTSITASQTQESAEFVKQTTKSKEELTDEPSYQMLWKASPLTLQKLTEEESDDDLVSDSDKEK